MDLLAERGRRVSVDELNTTRLLAHARKQAVQRKLDDILIVDVDAHHYENEHYSDILPYMENDVFRQWTMGGRGQTDRGSIVPTNAGFIQDMGGRVTRYPLRRSEKTEQGGKHRDVQLGERWMDAMSVDYSCLFPTGMLNIGMHPQKEMEVDLCWAYNRWVTEKVLPEAGGRMYSMLCLPFSDPAACVRQVETFGGRKGVTGFMVTTVRHLQVNDNAYMRLYSTMQERGLSLAFHSGPNWNEPVFRACNRFLSVHALGFTFYNILHLTNWVINGMGERFPKLPVIWIESGLAWVPFLMQRLDPEEEAVGLHARHVLLLAADGDSGPPGAGVHLPHDQRGDAAALLLGLSALGLRPAEHDLRPAVPVGEGQAQHPRRHRGAPVQAAAAQREAERKPQEIRQSRRRGLNPKTGTCIGGLPDRSGRPFCFCAAVIGARWCPARGAGCAARLRAGRRR
jgi:uncharacterized protein